MKKNLIGAIVTVLVAGTLLLDGGGASAAGRYTVTAAVGARSATVGAKVSLKGRVSPAAKGRKVIIEQRGPHSSRWSTLKRVTLSKASRYQTTVAARSAGSWSFRVVKPADRDHARGVSPVRVITGWRWRPVSGLPVVDSGSGTTLLDSVTLGGRAYRPAIRQGNGATRTYRLDQKCSKLDAFVGADPGSVNEGPFSTHLFGALPETPNSATEFVAENRVFPGDDPHHIIRGGATMLPLASFTFSANGFNPANAPEDGVVWASARVYCSF